MHENHIIYHEKQHEIHEKNSFFVRISFGLLDKLFL
jgi:hypothetical protein